MKLRLQVLVLCVLSLGLGGCGSVTPSITPTPPALLPETYPTPTPTTVLLSPHEEPGNLEINEGVVEIRIPFDIYSQNESLSIDVPECVNEIPFRFVKDETRTLIEGQGKIDCEFVDTPQEGLITYHVILDFDGTLNGELLSATPDKPSAWLDAQLLVDGTIIQFYTDYPQEATNPCPETSPCRITTSEVMPLPFDCKEGSTITEPWTFILHLQKSNE